MVLPGRLVEQREGIAPGTEAEAVPRAGMSQAGNTVQTV